MITTATGTTVQRVTGGTAATTTPVVAPATVTFDPTTTTLATTDATSVAVGDVNGDGFADVVVGANGSGATTKVFLNLRSTSTTVGNVTTVTWNGIETTASTSLGTDTATRAVLLADLTNDGSLDLVVVNTGVAHAVYVNLGLDAAGTTWQGLSAAVAVANTSAARGAAVADVDGDGFRDLVVAVDGAPAAVHRNLRFTGTTWNGLGAGTPVAALPATPSGRSVILSDVDGDGRADLLLGTTTETHLFLNRGGVKEAWKGFGGGAVVATGPSDAIALVNTDIDADSDLFTGGATFALHLAEPSAVTRIGFTGVTVLLKPSTGAGSAPGDAALSIINGQGAFVASGTGVAGTFTGTVDAAVPPFDGNITVSVKYNSTGGTVDEVIDVNGTPVPVLFDSTQVGTAAAPYVLVSGSGTIRLGNFVEVHGTLTFDGGSPSFTGVTFFIGQGPYKNDDGSLNPSAIGIVIDDASGSKVGTTGNAAFSGTGTVRLVGIPGLTLGGTITVQYNESTSAVQLGVPVASATAPYLFVGASDLTFAVNGMELKGGFSFTKGSNGEITVGLTTVSLDLGTAPAGGAAPVQIAVATGTIVLGTGTVGGAPAGIVVALDGLVVTVNAPGVVLGTGASRLLINTTSDRAHGLGLRPSPPGRCDCSSAAARARTGPPSPSRASR